MRSELPGSSSRRLRDVAPQDRIQIGVDHRRVAARDDLDQRRDAGSKR